MPKDIRKTLFPGDAYKMDEDGNLLRVTSFTDMVWGAVFSVDENSVTFVFPTSKFNMEAK